MFNIKRMAAPRVKKKSGYKNITNYRRLKLMYSNCYTCNTKLVASITIEHITPKSVVPELENEWSNLILCCMTCNGGKGSSEDIVIDPTSNISSIHKLFCYSMDGTIMINEYEIYQRCLQNSQYYSVLKDSVENTITLYKLNRDELKKDRKKVLINAIYTKKVELMDETEYRGMFMSMKDKLEKVGVIYE